ncbi:hypothetical protein PM082_006455 [Marasmius tenuissimus]|nr:hypothetical protein PM082_006455 [Marasmius tenuissimus]
MDRFSPHTPSQNQRNSMSAVDMNQISPPSDCSTSRTTSRHEERLQSRKSKGRPISARYQTSGPESLPLPYTPPVPSFYPPAVPLQPSFSLPSPITPTTTHNPHSVSNSSDPKEYRPRFKKPALTEKQKVARILDVAFDELNYGTLGDLLYALVPPIPVSSSHHFGKRHKNRLKAFLQGRCIVKPVTICENMADHRYGSPTYKSTHVHERNLSFSNSPPLELRYARPAITSWATRRVGDRVHKEIGLLTVSDKSTSDTSVKARLAASAKERSKEKGVVTISRDDMLKFRVQDRVQVFKKRAPLAWYLTERMAGPEEKGRVIVRKQRPHPMAQFAAISSFVIARNKFANGYFAVQAGVWHIACKSHIDVKRLYCRMGGSVADVTARTALRTLADDALAGLRTEVETANRNGRVTRRWVIDNTQRHSAVHEGGMARESRLITGTAGTAILLDDVASNAFDLADYTARVLKNERRTLTTLELYESIDWTHIHGIQALHALRTLCHFTPCLNPMLKLISERFRSREDGYAIHRMRDGRKTAVQPLGTNSEKEMETSGMIQCLDDFFKQSGAKPEYASKLISWVSGDGGSVMAMDRAKKYRALMYEPSKPSTTDYNTLHHLLPTMEIWHAQATCQNTIAENHYGPAASSDPSALSRSANAAKFKRPTNFRDSSNYYNLSRSMGTFWDALILDCWRIELGLDSHREIIPHFERLQKENKLPTFPDLLEKAKTLTSRYASLDAYEQALSADANESAPETHKFPSCTRSPSSPSVTETSLASQPTEDDSTNEMEIEQDDLENSENIPNRTPEEEGKKAEIPKEEPGFTGDRVLANLILFQLEYSWWIEAAYAVSEGDIGRAFEVIKIWLFMFAGSSNSNYRDLLLEMWCLFKYEASQELKDAIWNNWLVNLTGELGKWIPADLMQEHYNRWLEDHVEKSGLSFDDPFLRQTISPNVDFFLILKKEFELAFDLHKRSHSHTSPHLRDEFKALLQLYDDEEVHSFIQGRSHGHIAINLFNRGFERFDGGVLDDLLSKHTLRVEVLEKIDAIRKRVQVGSLDSGNTTAQLQPQPQPPFTSESVVPQQQSTSPPTFIPPSRSPSPSYTSVDSPDESIGEATSSSGDELQDDEVVINEDSSRLNPGPETIPEIDIASGQLVSDWMDDEELEREFERSNAEEMEEESGTFTEDEEVEVSDGNDSDDNE